MAVALGDTRPPTLLNLALAEQQAGDAARATRLMEELAQRLPDWDEPPLRLAEALRAQASSRRPNRPIAGCWRSIRGAKRRCSGLGSLLILRGDGEAARELLLRCCGIAPGRADAWDALGLALLLTADKKLAEAAFARAQGLAPAVLEYGLHRVDAAAAAGTEDSLLAWLEWRSDARSAEPGARRPCAASCWNAGRRTEAIDALEAATALAPDALLPLNFLGDLLAAPIACARRKPRCAAPSNSIPTISGCPTPAPPCCCACTATPRRAPSCWPRSIANGEQVNVLCNLANATVCLGLQEEGVALAHRAIALAPDAALPRRALCNTLPYRDGVTGAELLAALRDCSDRLPREPPPAFTNAPDPDRPLTIGLLSGSLRTHPVGWLTVAGFETLDPAAFASDLPGAEWRQ